jgi:hypothetical protein
MSMFTPASLELDASFSYRWNLREEFG